MKNSSLFISWTDLCTPPPSHKTIQISFELLYQKIFSTNVQNLYYNKFQLKGREDVWKKSLSNEPWAGIASLHSLHFAVVVDMANLKEMLVLTATYLTRELYWYIYLVKECKSKILWTLIIPKLKGTHCTMILWSFNAIV